MKEVEVPSRWWMRMLICIAQSDIPRDSSNTYAVTKERTRAFAKLKTSLSIHSIQPILNFYITLSFPFLSPPARCNDSRLLKDGKYDRLICCRIQDTDTEII